MALSLPAFEEGLFDELEDPLSAGLVLAKLGAPRAVEDEQVIVLAKVLESELTIGYGGCVGKQLQTLNGQKPLNLKQLAAMVVAKGEGTYLKFAFDKFTAVLERARSKQQASSPSSVKGLTEIPQKASATGPTSLLLGDGEGCGGSID